MPLPYEMGQQPASVETEVPSPVVTPNTETLMNQRQLIAFNVTGDILPDVNDSDAVRLMLAVTANVESSIALAGYTLHPEQELDSEEDSELAIDLQHNNSPASPSVGLFSRDSSPRNQALSSQTPVYTQRRPSSLSLNGIFAPASEASSQAQALTTESSRIVYQVEEKQASMSPVIIQRPRLSLYQTTLSPESCDPASRTLSSLLLTEISIDGFTPASSPAPSL